MVSVLPLDGLLLDVAERAKRVGKHPAARSEGHDRAGQLPASRRVPGKETPD